MRGNFSLHHEPPAGCQNFDRLFGSRCPHVFGQRECIDWKDPQRLDSPETKLLVSLLVANKHRLKSEGPVKVTDFFRHLHWVNLYQIWQTAKTYTESNFLQTAFCDHVHGVNIIHQCRLYLYLVRVRKNRKVRQEPLVPG